MKDEQKWIQDIRSKMDNYAEPLPSAMWERVEASLDTPKVIPLWRRWQAVAAVALIVVASSLTFWFWVSPAADLMEQQGRQLAQQDVPAVMRRESGLSMAVEPVLVAEPKTRAVAVAERPEIRSLQHSAIPTLRNAEVVPAVDAAETLQKEALAEQEWQPEETGVANSEGQKEAKTRGAVRHTDRERMRKNASRRDEANRSERNRVVQLGLAAGNAPYSSSNSFGGFGRMAARTVNASGDLLMSPISDKSTAYSQVLFNNREQTPTTDIRHRMPVTLGASVKWNFKKGWALETGLTYTILSSESHAGSPASYMDEEWKLHYIGIPLKLHRSIWENKRFHIYASAGGAVEKSVSGSLETVYVTGTERETESSSLHVGELQWSVTAAAGAQVNITPWLGLYVEPGVAYFFDDGSDVETFRKDHPLNFNLQLGMRFSFGK